MKRPRTSTGRRTLRVRQPELPRYPSDPLWQLGPGLEVARLVEQYVADMERLERSEVWG